ncbi:hypothetical protein M413DRAFT_347916 [Hebeloma cylindrosporum]|uniref:Uncharacterized protein n=1 Tax=Hebeloma cylindrosporum TaxID=76867 RepID=A0A0C3BU21_HEBCY|nr:hypothetical protein M413DRAFT_347916 [Hebeloma cylindrosporum h7]
MPHDDAIADELVHSKGIIRENLRVDSRSLWRSSSSILSMLHSLISHQRWPTPDQKSGCCMTLISSSFHRTSRPPLVASIFFASFFRSPPAAAIAGAGTNMDNEAWSIGCG